MPAHVKAALLKTSEQIPVRDGELALGTWQGLYVWEHRSGLAPAAGRRPRAGRVSAMRLRTQLALAFFLLAVAAAARGDALHLARLGAGVPPGGGRRGRRPGRARCRRASTSVADELKARLHAHAPPPDRPGRRAPYQKARREALAAAEGAGAAAAGCGRCSPRPSGGRAPSRSRSTPTGRLYAPEPDDEPTLAGLGVGARASPPRGRDAAEWVVAERLDPDTGIAIGGGAAGRPGARGPAPHRRAQPRARPRARARRAPRHPAALAPHDPPHRVAHRRRSSGSPPGDLDVRVPVPARPRVPPPRRDVQPHGARPAREPGAAARAGATAQGAGDRPAHPGGAAAARAAAGRRSPR